MNVEWAFDFSVARNVYSDGMVNNIENETAVQPEKNSHTRNKIVPLTALYAHRTCDFQLFIFFFLSICSRSNNYYDSGSDFQLITKRVESMTPA